MPVDQTDGDQIYLSPVEWWTDGGQQLITPVRKSLIKLTDPILRQGVTRYKDWKHADPRWVREGAGDHVYGAARGGAGDYTIFVWNPPIPLPAEEGAHPEILIKEEWTVENYSWPSILTSLEILVDKAIKEGLTSGDTNRKPVDRSPGVDGMTVPTRTQKLTYVSTVSPPPDVLRINPPLPSPIQGDYYGHPVRLPACLHPEVTLESQASDDAILYDCTPDVTAERTGNILLYPATNHLTWVPHISDMPTEDRDGLYRRTVIRRIPPPLPPPSYI